MNARSIAVTAAGLILVGLATVACLSAPPRAARTIKITPEEAMRLFFQRREYAKVKKIALALLWNDIRRPEEMYYLAAASDRLKEAEPAAVYFHLLLRLLEDTRAKPHPRADWFKRYAENRLKVLDAAHRRLQEKYERAAAGKKFTAAEEVDDLWMTQVRCDLHNLHGLYAWKLVGGRKDFKKEWIHNRKGEMHRSGMKYVDEVHGRKGVLFGIPIKAKTSKDADKHHRAVLKRLGHPTRITTRNPGKCRYLRIGARAYGFGFILKACAGQEQVFSGKVSTGKWSDLKIDLNQAAGKDRPVIVELVVPEKQRWSEGAWIDYIDFFEN